MAFTKKTWKDRVAEYISRRTLTYEDGTTKLVTVTRSEGTISQEGDAFNSANMNDLENRIANAMPVIVRGTLGKGATSITLSNSAITTNSIILPSSKWGVNPINVTQVTGSVTLTFVAQSTATEVGIVVFN